MEKEKTEAISEQKQPDGIFSMKMGRTTYQIGMYFSKTGKESMNDKVRRMMKKDVMAESSK
jgi:hypothetical protein